MKIGDRVVIKWNPNNKMCKIIGIKNDKYKVRELSKHGTVWYGLSEDDILNITDVLVEIPEEYLISAEEIAAVQIKEDQDQNESGKDRPPRD